MVGGVCVGYQVFLHTKQLCGLPYVHIVGVSAIKNLLTNRMCLSMIT